MMRVTVAAKSRMEDFRVLARIDTPVILIIDVLHIIVGILKVLKCMRVLGFLLFNALIL